MIRPAFSTENDSFSFENAWAQKNHLTAFFDVSRAGTEIAPGRMTARRANSFSLKDHQEVSQ